MYKLSFLYQNSFDKQVCKPNTGKLNGVGVKKGLFSSQLQDMNYDHVHILLYMYLYYLFKFKFFTPVCSSNYSAWE